MSVAKPWKSQSNSNKFNFNKNYYSWKSMVFYVILCLLLLLCYFSPLSTFTTYDHLQNVSSISIISHTNSSSSSSTQGNSNRNASSQEQPTTDNISSTTHNSEISTDQTCDYNDGVWVRDSRGPLYNGTTCKTIKDGQNCMSHGRPDTDYLHWRWRPRKCNLSRFDPRSFLEILEGKHVAFIGDSLARNQLESLLCMLSSYSDPNLVYSNGDDNKFRRWHFPSRNVTVSVYWSPFLVKGVEKSKNRDYNRLFLDSADERWASDLDSIDVAVLSVGHWYLLKAIFVEGSVQLGCHGFESTNNCSEIGFYDPFQKAINTSLRTIVQRKGVNGKKTDVVVTTFSPHHFEDDWDKLGACPKKVPYNEGDMTVEGMNDNLRRIAVEEVDKARDHILLNNVRITALDVTKLSLLRPDGHPGPYMYFDPFKDGVKERVHNDCVHWCLPGPIDTWNEIMSDIIKRWHTS